METNKKLTIDSRLLGLGVSSLLVGTLFYIIARPPEYIYFLNAQTSLYRIVPDPFGIAGYYLPTFIHTFAFALITAGVLGFQKASTFLSVCVGWLLFEVIFELGQHDLVCAKLFSNNPEWFALVPFLGNIQNYFKHGTFDSLDVLSIILGAVSAFLTMNFFRTQEVRHESQMDK